MCAVRHGERSADSLCCRYGLFTEARSGLTVLLDAPDGVWTTLSGGAVNVQSATTFTATAMLNKVGVWDITVHSADGLESNEVQFSVSAAH